MMTILMQWMVMGVVILGPWLAVFVNDYQSPWVDQNKLMILVYPLVLVAVFGIYSIVIIAWRVYNFNDCSEAAKELRAPDAERRPFVSGEESPDPQLQRGRCVSGEEPPDPSLQRRPLGGRRRAQPPGGPRGAAGDSPVETWRPGHDRRPCELVVDLPSAGQLPGDLDVTDPGRYRRAAAALLGQTALPVEADRAALFRRTRHDRDAWFAARRGRVTASAFQRVANMRPSTSCRSVLDALLYGARADLNTPGLRYGRDNEEVAVKAYETEMGCVVERPAGLVVHPQHGFVAATPDGIVSNEHILEVKCPKRAEHVSLDALALVGGFFLDGGMRLKRGHAYYSQVQCQLACTGASFCDFFVWSPLQTACDRIAFDPVFWEEKMERVRQFYLQCLLPELVDPRRARNLHYRERACYTGRG